MKFLPAVLFSLVWTIGMSLSVYGQEQEPRTFPGGEIDSVSVSIRLQEPQGTVNADQDIFTIIEFRDFDYRPDFETDAATEFASSATINGEFVEEIQLDGLGHVHVYFQPILSATGFPETANTKEIGSFCAVSDNNTVLFNDASGTSGFIFTLCPAISEPGLYRVCAEAQSHSHSSRIRASADDFPGVDCTEVTVLPAGATTTTTSTTTTTAASTTTTTSDATTTTIDSSTTTIPDTTTTTTTLPDDIVGQVKGILESLGGDLVDLFTQVVDAIDGAISGLMDLEDPTTTTTVVDTTTTTVEGATTTLVTTTTTGVDVTTTTLDPAQSLLDRIQELIDQGQGNTLQEVAPALLQDELPENLPSAFVEFENEALNQEALDDDDDGELEDDDDDGEDDDDDGEDDDDDDEDDDGEVT